MTQKASKLLGFFILGTCLSCGNIFQKSSYYQTDYKTGLVEQRQGLGFQMPVKYDIDVFFLGDAGKQPQLKYEVIKELELSSEEGLNAKQTQNEKLLYRGNTQDQKKALLDQMVKEAMDLGAGALVDVSYKVYSSQHSTGYIFKAKAVRYLDN